MPEIALIIRALLLLLLLLVLLSFLLELDIFILVFSALLLQARSDLKFLRASFGVHRYNLRI
jgi:hypothetical protein